MGQTMELAEVLKRQEEELERTKQRLGQNIKARREALGYSQEKLAFLSGWVRPIWGTSKGEAIKTIPPFPLWPRLPAACTLRWRSCWRERGHKRKRKKMVKLKFFKKT